MRVSSSIALVSRFTFVHAFEKLYNVALDAQHDTFGFRVAHTYIIFDNHRLVLYIDKSQEMKPLYRMPSSRSPLMVAL